MNRRLTLKRESLSDLTPNDLAAVAAAGATTDCFTGYYRSLNAPCPTLDGCFELAALPSLNTPCPTTNCFTGTSGHTVTCS